MLTCSRTVIHTIERNNLLIQGITWIASETMLTQKTTDTQNYIPDYPIYINYKNS